MIRWILLSLAFCACNASIPKVERQRRLLAEHCGECHDSKRRTALPGALAIFDVDDVSTVERLSEARRSSIRHRLAEPLVPTRGKIEAAEQHTTAEELALFDP